MPTTRRSAASARGRPGPAKGQSTISFSGKVTKAVPKDLKKAVVDAPMIARTTIPERPAAKDEVRKEEEEAVNVAVEETEVVEPEKEEEVEEIIEQVPEKSEAELKAEKITDTQIKSYWKDIEKQRKAPRVHQQDLDLGEKVLRYFDVSSQYGRAERLGLNPPIEVLAVLVKEENRNNDEVETAHIDRIMNATALFT
ncbi:DNA polymerase delta subunit 4 [Trichoderma gamsii]|uniref:DNA polymerase delta subunit 4 n=1 Tax=Trichoderma gamsii TaxID=398673 RepID=A0A2P4ZY92_9HYPO|nr:DNA polymerase delta subunit 4 [Trichoderma gamsii]PON29267.1 DNA polymerase delta subunit 4 [Trichoderma gamsii]